MQVVYDAFDLAHLGDQGLELQTAGQALQPDVQPLADDVQGGPDDEDTDEDAAR